MQVPLMGVTVSPAAMGKLWEWLGTGARATGVERVTAVRKALGSEL